MLRELEKILELQRAKVQSVWEFIEEVFWPSSHSLLANQPKAAGERWMLVGDLDGENQPRPELSFIRPDTQILEIWEAQSKQQDLSVIVERVTESKRG